jgi:hypothetical protein
MCADDKENDDTHIGKQRLQITCVSSLETELAKQSEQTI